VTEAEWLASDDPVRMIDWLRRSWRHVLFETGMAVGLVGRSRIERRFRLIACAVARSAWAAGGAEPDRAAVEAAERYADGRATRRDLDAAGESYGVPASRPVALKFASDAATHTAHEAAAALASNHLDDPRRRPVYRHVAALVRDIFGNPFRPVVFDPRWRTGDAVGLARGVYDERAFDRLPLLADALMDAGCADDDILMHCRSSGPHVRGCWVVDLILSKDR
jgi:hypothetical protein